MRLFGSGSMMIPTFSRWAPARLSCTHHSTKDRKPRVRSTCRSDGLAPADPIRVIDVNPGPAPRSPCIRRRVINLDVEPSHSRVLAILKDATDDIDERLSGRVGKMRGRDTIQRVPRVGSPLGPVFEVAANEGVARGWASQILLDGVACGETTGHPRVQFLYLQPSYPSTPPGNPRQAGRDQTVSQRGSNLATGSSNAPPVVADLRRYSSVGAHTAIRRRLRRSVYTRTITRSCINPSATHRDSP